MMQTHLCRALALFVACLSVVGGEAIGGEPAPPVRCAGIVTDGLGKPLGGVDVKQYRLSEGASEASPIDVKLMQERVTGDDGRFDFGSVPQATGEELLWLVVADKPGMAIGWANWGQDRDPNAAITLTTPGVLAGRVLDETGAPVPDAQVEVAVMVVLKSGQVHFIVGQAFEGLLQRRSDAQGAFRFDRIPADASAEFIVRKVGLATANTHQADYDGEGPLQFAAGREDVAITLVPEARIEGLAVGKSTGRPVGGVMIMAALEQSHPFLGIHPALSRDDGTFALEALKPGKYAVSLVWGRKESPQWLGDPVEVDVAAGQTVRGVKLGLSQPGVVEVFVTEAGDDTPVAGANVGLDGIVSRRTFWANTNRDGLASFRLPAGDYSVGNVFHSDFPSQQNLASFQVEEGKTIRVPVRLQGANKVTGIVRDEQDRPVAGAQIKICPAGSTAVVSDEKGRYSARWQLARGEQGVATYVVVRHPQRNLAGAAEVPESGGNVDVTVTEGVVFFGRVVDVEGRAIGGAEVRLSFWSGGHGQSVNEAIATDAEGRYEIPAAPRDYRFTTYASKEGYGEKYSQDLFSSPTEGNRVEVEPLVLAKADRSVSGVVVDEEDKPVAGANVSCYGPDQPWRRVKTDDQGRFKVDGVCAGSVNVQADSRNLSGSIRAQADAQDIKIVVSPSRRQAAGPRPVSLLGKRAPDLKAFGPRVADGNAVGKPLVICFWDMAQRPSRNCIQQLAKQADSLQQKGIVVLAIQATKPDAAALDAWLKENRIPFPVGAVAGEEEKSLAAWGVQSLPWLILTDKNHNVAAEGFAIGDLDAKIEKTAP